MASAATVNDFKSLSFGDSQCRGRLTELFTKVAFNVLGFFLFAFCCNAFHFVLKPFSQPRITTDTFVGLVIGNLGFIHRLVNQSAAKTLRFIVDFGMICYMFVLGLEMDPQALFRAPTKDAKVAYAGMASTFVLVCAATPFLHYTTTTTPAMTLALAAALSSTGSPVLTRLVTSLKIGKSDIGRLVIAAGMHSDFMSTLALSLGFIVFPVVQLRKTLMMVGALAFQTLMATAVAPILVNWVNNENPEGKPMKGSHLILALTFMILVCCVSPVYGYNPMLSAFVAGVCLPRQGRLSRWVVSKINYLLNTIFYPIFFFWMGFEAQLGDFEASHIMTWVRLFVLFIVVTLGKVVGTVVSGAMLGFNWPESVAIGLLLTAKGHFHIYLAIASKTIGKTSASTSTVMIIVIFFTVVHAPWVISQIIKRARKRAPTHRMSLELLDPSSELRVLACLHGPHNVPALVNLVEISRGGPVGAVIYVTDMVELTVGIAATLVKGDGPDTVTVTDPAVVRMREEVNASVEAYKAATSLEGLAIRRMLALSTFTGLPQDVCILAEDLMTALIILPFHKNAATNAAHSGFRYVNRKVLRNAPCSVGILVDRGLGIFQPYAVAAAVKVAVIFIGGKDDREALAFSGRVARHPGVKLTVVRFVVDDNNPDNAAARRAAGNYRMASATEQEEETALDDTCFAEFYERHMTGSGAGPHPVAYLEKHLANSSETLLTLKSFEGQYSLVIVGRGGRVNSVLTFGMSDWQQCPELGPVADVLSGADFAASMSVLVVQQHDPKGELDGLDDEFSIM